MEPMFEPDCKLDSTTNDRGSSEYEEAEGRQRERAREGSTKANITKNKRISTLSRLLGLYLILRKDSVRMAAHGGSLATIYK
jgi:hypothetical protein